MEVFKLGIDIGSTTVKLALLDEKNQLVYSNYCRHRSDIKSTLSRLARECYNKLGDRSVRISITGSGGLSVSKWLDINFIQEVIACSKAVETYIPETDVAIELGGEDAKITYFRNGMEQRMNGSCAGGTGAFIDQMAVLLDTDAEGLNEYAKKHHMIYPIASRCGVFAKTDVQPLINDGARREDIAASILQAVANQTIGGLACGKPIKGKVAFLGGPLYFLSQLRERFTESLKLDENHTIAPENSQIYVAMGAALSSSKEPKLALSKLVNKVDRMTADTIEETRHLEPLFTDKEQYREFVLRHSKAKVAKEELSTYSGDAFLGIDAGSTTTKVVLIGEEGQLLYSRYSSNEGEPLRKLVPIILQLYELIPSKVKIRKCTVTGYGEALIKAALHADIGEIETIAHYKAAKHFLPEVDFILDIGGQDMKCLRIKNGAIDSILLNEACSSGCGSFLEGFAKSLGMTIDQFAREALFAKAPVELGTKCTVFMNSKVKQAQKEGADLPALSAGLSYSVIKNALFKVIKVRSDSDLGNNIIVQGGTFYNDSVLRCFELITGKQAIRPDIAGLMGAYGAALIAKERYKEGEVTSLLPREELIEFAMKAENRRCDKCTNHCLLTINTFTHGENSHGESFIAGNRCEKGLGSLGQQSETLPNLYDYKYKRTFDYTPLPLEQATRGEIGIPRVMNLYENYPFWFTLFTNLGFRVILSGPSTKKLYERGLETIPSESACYPAKLCHGHILNLIEKGVDTIFYPSVVYERKEYQEANNHYNCPIVISYPEVVRNNIDELKLQSIRFINPFLSLDHDRKLAVRMVEELQSYHIGRGEMKRAIQAANLEREHYKQDLRRQGETALAFLKENNRKGIVLCGKPYHVDPEINHGIAKLINSYGMAVLTEDSIAHLASLKQKLRVVDQWVYNSRLYRAASLVAEEPSLEMIQLNSFGCGLDAVTSDQIAEILASGGKLYTMLKIDEGNNLGAAKIRIRSLKAAVEERNMLDVLRQLPIEIVGQPVFTKEMKYTHTILAPQMAPIHFELVQAAARACGYRMEVLPAVDKSAVDEGLKYVNNDACYPAILMIGQVVQALKSGKYDVNQTSVIMTQSGGGCRATNYIAFLKLGLRQAGFGQVPVISLSTMGLEKQPGFKLSLGLINRCIMALIYGDLFMRLIYHTRPYERFPGSAQVLYEKWKERAKDNVKAGGRKEFHYNIHKMIEEFDHLELCEVQKPRVAVVGEILLKYHPTANNDIITIIEQGGAEAVVPDLMDYFLYSTYNSRFRFRYLAGSKLNNKLSDVAMWYIISYRNIMNRELASSRRFLVPTPIDELAHMASSVLSLGNQTGEGWLVTAEMMEFLEQGTKNILCIQPLACLPNHVTGKGMIKPLKELFPQANIMPIDYDPGISSVNQLNRIKLMLSIALKEVKSSEV
ncbi:MAG: hypothetical protein K0R46_345 [Herbinix sp.]|nr:hypothetical protein [Herbinix sp.]